jgi:hypothetical protein
VACLPVPHPALLALGIKDDYVQNAPLSVQSAFTNHALKGIFRRQDFNHYIDGLGRVRKLDFVGGRNNVWNRLEVRTDFQLDLRAGAIAQFLEELNQNPLDEAMNPSRHRLRYGFPNQYSWYGLRSPYCRSNSKRVSFSATAAIQIFSSKLSAKSYSL